MDKQLLSICISTYNRKWQLYTLLNLLRLFNVNKYRIIVGDDCSQDGTYEMMRLFVDDENIVYIRNDENLGYDRNFRRIIEEAVKYSDYSFWIGDDDFPLESMFTEIPAVLREKRPDLVILNAENYSDGLIYMEISEDKEEHDLVGFIREWSRYQFRWGQYIVSNSMIESLTDEQKNKYMGYHHIAWGMIAEGLYNCTRRNADNRIKALFTAKPYVVTSCVAASYSNMVEEILYGFGATYALYPDELRGDVYDIVREMLSTVRSGQCLGIWKGYIEECERHGVYHKDERPVPFEEYVIRNNVVNKLEKDSYVLFGAGNNGRKCLSAFRYCRDKIKYFVDNDKEKWGKEIEGIGIYPVDKLKGSSSNIFVIVDVQMDKRASVFRQLEKIGLRLGEDYMSWERILIDLYQIEKYRQDRAHGEIVK